MTSQGSERHTVRMNAARRRVNRHDSPVKLNKNVKNAIVFSFRAV